MQALAATRTSAARSSLKPRFCSARRPASTVYAKKGEYSDRRLKADRLFQLIVRDFKRLGDKGACTRFRFERHRIVGLE